MNFAIGPLAVGSPHGRVLDRDLCLGCDGEQRGPRIADVARTADQLSQRGTEVRFLRAIFVPEDETCFYLYQSSLADAVREAATRARLPFERMTEAVSIEAPDRVVIRNLDQ